MPGEPLKLSGHVVPKSPLALCGATRLDQLERHRFFSAALLYLFAQFNEAPLFDFLDQYPAARIVHRLFGVEIFGGLEQVDPRREWCRSLWAVDQMFWPALENFLLSIMLKDSPRRVLYRIGTQKLLIPDPLVLENGGILGPDTPRLWITSFGVNGSDRRVAFTTSGHPTLQILPPDEKAVRIAKAVFKDENPADVLDTHYRNPKETP